MPPITSLSSRHFNIPCSLQGFANTNDTVHWDSLPFSFDLHLFLVSRINAEAPLKAMHKLEAAAQVRLAILRSNIAPINCASPVDDELKFLGTSADEVLNTDHTAFAIPALQTYMKPDAHFSVDCQGHITHTSRRGMYYLVHDLATPESNVVHATLCGATFVLLKAVAH
jgi:hypothetical protein